jgi:hypothetical protein
MKKLAFPSGFTFNKLTIVEYNSEKRKYLCLCECGNKVFIRTDHIRDTQTKSCGCWRKKFVRTWVVDNKKLLTQNDWLLYNRWYAMYSRCYKPNNPAYKNYGARGIKMCEEWLKSPYSFIKDMSTGFEKSLTIDRINVDGNYCKENCRWATKKEQSLNKRISVIVTYKGKTQNLSQWADELNIDRSTIGRRYRLLKNKNNLNLDLVFSTSKVRRGLI